jgi:lysozyme family protein
MAKVSNLAPFILKWEGGFSNHSADRGGATMKGVTIGTFTQYRKDKGLKTPTVSDLKNISDSEWTDIMKKYYWDAWKADQINNQAVANILVDWAWGSGATTSIKAFQNIIPSLISDGVAGAKTIGYINDVVGSDRQIGLFNKIWSARKDFLTNIVAKNPSQMVFLNGWMNRLFDLYGYNFSLIPKFS